MLRIAYDMKASTEFNPLYFVYDTEHLGAVVYKGKYIQCLCIVGAVSLEPGITIEEINSKTNGFLLNALEV
jgi:hypothetical protein